ncbi:NACHT domain-containing protein [bacterium SCSIO 12643]|nr:NACHT domain-containing protein [bacterium SCSIO 12643]
MDITTIITGVVGAKLTSLFTGIAKDFGEEIKHTISNNILEYQVEEYNRNSISKTLLHRVEPKRLKEFYQPLFITNCGPNSKPTHFGRKRGSRIATDSIEKLFEKKQFITLIGSAGSGKSTIVKYLFLNAIDSDFKVPIKLELRYLNDYDGSVIEYIKDKIFKLGRLASIDKIVERLMKSGDFVFFLDGYDEITSVKKEKITKEIDDLVKLYNSNNYLLTSRPYTEIDLLPLFHNFEVCELSDEDINQFIQKQIPLEESELQAKIIEAINSPENSSYKTFLSNPLLLSMFILTFQSYSSIPQKRSAFYSQVFDALFSVHDSMSKLAFVREKQSGLSKEQIVEVLELFSFISYFEQKFIFTNKYLNDKLNTIKSKKSSIKFTNNKLITDLQIAIGIINQDGTEFTFPHRSLQEYFTAAYISSLSDSNKKTVYKKVLTALTDDRTFIMNSNDNFHLLLSELDEVGIIRFGVIPYLKSYLDSINIKTTSTKKIITYFINLQNVYESFYSVIKCNELSIQNEEFSKLFRKYNPMKKGEKHSSKEGRKRSDVARAKLAKEDIKPFLKTYIPKIKDKIQELESYLEEQDNSDTDIISLI